MFQRCCAGSKTIHHPHRAADADRAFGVQQQGCPGLAPGLVRGLDGFKNAAGIEGAQLNLRALLLQQIRFGELG